MDAFFSFLFPLSSYFAWFSEILVGFLKRNFSGVKQFPFSHFPPFILLSSLFPFVRTIHPFLRVSASAATIAFSDFIKSTTYFSMVSMEPGWTTLDSSFVLLHVTTQGSVEESRQYQEAFLWCAWRIAPTPQFRQPGQWGKIIIICSYLFGHCNFHGWQMVMGKKLCHDECHQGYERGKREDWNHCV